MSYVSIGNGLYARAGSGKRKPYRAPLHLTPPPSGDRVIYRLRDGQMVKVNEPLLPLKANFVIVCDYGDWSGFRTLAECEKQFPTLVSCDRPNGYYEVVER